MDLEVIKHFDEKLIIALHGGNNLFLDNFAIALTNAYIWIPLYIVLLFLIIKNNKKSGRVFLVLIVLIGSIILSNILNNLIMKPTFERLRPFCNPYLQDFLPLVNGYTAEGFSFYSSHTSNCFFILTFVTLLVRNKTLFFFLFVWAIIIAWTRLYLGVHYPTDVFTGMFVGTLLASLGYVLFYKINNYLQFKSAQYVKTEYRLADINIVLNVFILTFICAVFYAVLQI